MRLSSLLLSIPVLALALSHANDASAGGGCFHQTGAQPPATIEVTGHKMIVSISATQTTLWDQIAYSGDPASFAWVLPVKGNVTFAVSSDALFQNLNLAAAVELTLPKIDCYGANSCVYGGATGTGYTIAGGGGSGVPNTAPSSTYAHQVVGPYEMVQVHSSDPAALTTWLTDHSFAIPDDVKPIIAAYVAEGFDFLAVKLVPGEGMTAMRPIRVTTTGGSPVLPLRMLAAGAGPTMPVTLWVMAAGRYEAANMPDFTLQSNQITWDWNAVSSNYAELEKSQFAASMGKAWHVEVAEPFSPDHLKSVLDGLAASVPKASGYADAMGQGAPEAETADLAALFGNLDPATLWVTRLHAELSPQALSNDLTLGASAVQAPVNRFLKPGTILGATPVCAKDPPCSGTGGAGGDSSGASSAGGCSMSVSGGFSSMLGAVSVLAALALLRRRQAR